MPLPPRSNRTRGSLASQAVAGSSTKYSGFCVSTTSWPIAGWASKARAGWLIIGSPATGTSGFYYFSRGGIDAMGFDGLYGTDLQTTGGRVTSNSGVYYQRPADEQVERLAERYSQ